MQIEDKNKLIQFLVKSIQGKLKKIMDDMAQLQISKESETKSSAGDKYETGREMIQAEFSKLESVRTQLKKQLNILQTLQAEKTPEKIAFGSLVETHTAFYFISISGDAIKDRYIKPLYPVSAASPLAQNMIGKSVGDSVSINGTLYTIVSHL